MRIAVLFMLVMAACSLGMNAAAEIGVIAVNTDISPLIDGMGDDPVWRTATETAVHDPIADIDIHIKAAYTEREIFFLVRFDDPDESRRHKPWVWNPGTDSYDMGPDREDTLVLKWAMESQCSDLSIHADQPYQADIWFWKAGRTDPSGYADDKRHVLQPIPMPGSKKITSRSGGTIYLQRPGDGGKSAYSSVIKVMYEGDVIPQFSHQEPSGSRADVRAKGIWESGAWKIEFARQLLTGHSDDVQFDTGRKYLFGVSRYEIAGREPDPATTQPFHGAGDIAENLILTFTR
jgi:hypothetical protein